MIISDSAANQYRAIVGKVRAACDAHALNLDGIAAGMGSDALTLQRKLNGQNTFTVSDLGNLSRVLGCSATDLLA